jgi:hypothetical protein
MKLRLFAIAMLSMMFVTVGQMAADSPFPECGPQSCPKVLAK